MGRDLARTRFLHVEHDAFGVERLRQFRIAKEIELLRTGEDANGGFAGRSGGTAGRDRRCILRIASAGLLVAGGEHDADHHADQQQQRQRRPQEFLHRRFPCN